MEMTRVAANDEKPVPTAAMSDAVQPTEVASQSDQLGTQKHSDGSSAITTAPSSSSSGVQIGTSQGSSGSGSGGNDNKDNATKRHHHLWEAQNVPQDAGIPGKKFPPAKNKAGSLFTLQHHDEQRWYKHCMDNKLLQYYKGYMEALKTPLDWMVAAEQQVLQSLNQASSAEDVQKAKKLGDTQEMDLCHQLFPIHKAQIEEGKKVFTEPAHVHDHILKGQQEEFCANIYRAYLDHNPKGLTMEMATQAHSQFMVGLTPVNTMPLRPVPLLAFPRLNPIYSHHHSTFNLLHQPTSVVTTSGSSIASASSIPLSRGEAATKQIPVSQAQRSLPININLSTLYLVCQVVTSATGDIIIETDLDPLSLASAPTNFIPPGHGWVAA